MNKKQTRLFAIGSSAIAALAFIGMTIDSHGKFDQLTNADKITPAVSRGKDVWHKNNCINCHTVFGEGAYYAPDLTKITKHRGEAYLTAYLRDPSKFYDETRHRRLMPKQDLSETDITDLIAFLDWISNVDNQGWPPRPILVTGGTLSGSGMSVAQQTGTSATSPGAQPVAGDENPIALGEKVYRSASPACAACHSIVPGVNMAGPSFSGLAARTEKLLASGEYKGKAKDLASYIHESILEPSAYVVPGPMYSASGVSFMPTTYGKDLTPAQIDQLAAYLSSLK
ncbi:MAG: cytochrome c [Candidatus Dechloromonas phosphoritropha]|mgnify:CR=1 FL=1|jgi:nitric oxide reductase subunit C